MVLLESDFFDRDADQVAQALLGKVLRRRVDNHWLGARIIETESYYIDEKASHSSLGRTPGREAMFIVSGAASVRRNGSAIAELGPGDVLGEMSLINQAPRNATVTADSDMVVLLMNSREFADVLRASPDLSLRILQTVAARLEHNAA